MSSFSPSRIAMPVLLVLGAAVAASAQAPPLNPNLEEREVFLPRDQVLVLSQQLAAKQAAQPPQQQRRGGLGGVLGGVLGGRGAGVNLAEGARALLQFHAGSAAAVGTHFVVVVIGNEEDRTKVRASLAEVQTRTLLMYLNADLQTAQVDHTPLKGGGPLAVVSSLTATNLWFYKPSLGMAANRAPDQVLPMKAASAKVWAGLFAAAGDYSLATTELTKTLTRPAQAAPAEPVAAAPGGISIGDVLVPKIANVKVMAAPSDAGKTVMTLTKADELVVIGAEKDGFVQVQGASGEGWVKLTLVNKQ